MAEIKRIRELVQGRCRTLDASYASIIDTSIGAIWGVVARSSEWWFMRAGKPIQVTVAAGAETFTVPSTTRLGRILHVSNEHDRRLWTYKSRTDYLLCRRGQPDDSTSDSSAIFTDYGIVTVDGATRRQFRVYPMASDAQTGYLHYQEPGTLENLSLLPDEWGIVIFHGVMSILAAPEKVPTEKWLAIAYQEEQLFQHWLKEMLFNEGRAVEDTVPEIKLDDQMEGRLDAIADL